MTRDDDEHRGPGAGDPASQPAHPSEQLSAWIEGELSAPEAAAVEQHLAGCEPCRKEADALRSTLAALSALQGSPPAQPPDLVAGVVDRVRTRSRGRFFGPETRRLARYEIASAVMLLMVIVVYVVMKLLSPGGLDLR